MSDYQPQQTIESAIRTDTGETLLASELLSMDPEEFVIFRRDTLRGKRRFKRSRGAPTPLICSVCLTPVWLTRKVRAGKTINRYFMHSGPALCPWYDPSRFSADQILALRFNGQKEGREHRELKQFIIDRLHQDPDADDIESEKVQLSKVIRGEWRKPDVACTWRAHKLVIELQLSYTFLSEIVGRDDFYQQEGNQVLWVFSSLHPSRAVQQDELYFNKRNLFVLDESARVESLVRGRLVLSCYYTEPTIIDASSTIIDRPMVRQVELDELTFPEDGFRPYFFDYDARLSQLREELAKRHLQEALEKARLQDELLDQAKPAKVADTGTASAQDRPNANRRPGHKALQVPNEGIDASLNAFLWELLNYSGVYEPGAPEKDHLAAMADQIVDPVMRRAVQDAMQSGPHLGALQRLLSIAVGAPVVTKFPTIYQVLDAAVQSSADTQRKFAYLYLSAWNLYRPAMKPEQEGRLAEKLNDVRTSMTRLDSPYRPSDWFGNLAAALFPRLEKVVAPLRGGRELLPSGDVSPTSTFDWNLPFDRERAKWTLRDHHNRYPRHPWKPALELAYEAHTKKGSVEAAARYASRRTGIPGENILRFLLDARMITYG